MTFLHNLETYTGIHGGGKDLLKQVDTSKWDGSQTDSTPEVIYIPNWVVLFEHLETIVLKPLLFHLASQILPENASSSVCWFNMRYVKVYDGF